MLSLTTEILDMDALIIFLRTETELRENDFKSFRDSKITGRCFLLLNKEELKIMAQRKDFRG